VSGGVESILSSLGDGPAAPVYLVAGDLVLAEPAAQRLARALADRAGCEPEIHRHPPKLTPLLDDLRTFSLFAAAKVVLAVDTALLADREAAAELIDDAEGALPLAAAGGELAPRERQGAARLLQALRLFEIDPDRGSREQALAALPEWALAGGGPFRKRRGGRGRSKKQGEELRGKLVELLAAARDAGLVGAAEGDLAELAAVVEGGLPDGHSLVLAERAAAKDHPLVASLARRGLLVEVGGVEAGRDGAWHGLDLLAEELGRQTGTSIAADALAELARRTLRQEGDWRKGKGVDADSSGRFAAEYRKLATLVGSEGGGGEAAGGGRIERRLVADVVADRGEEDVWQLLDAVGSSRGGEALARLGRMLGSASDPVAARLGFFALLAGFCRQLVAVRGLMELKRIPTGERSYPRFKSRLAPALQGALPDGADSPVASLHPFRLHRAYLAAGRFAPAAIAALPWRVLETEMQLKGESGDPDTALAQLVAHLAAG
jgi:DNA polymerase III delta subunit